jgi:hypothetical protein
MNARRKKLIGVIAFTCGIALLAWMLLYPQEPACKGKSLTFWAQQYGSNNWRGGGGPAAREAEVAIRQIGTNAIPFLLDLIRVRDSALKKKLREMAPRAWHDRLHIKDTSWDIRRTGAHGLAALGTNAPGAVPALIEIVMRHPDEDGRYLAAFALRTLGTAAEPAIPFFIQCLTNKVNTIRDEAAIALGGMHHLPEIVVPQLVSYLNFAKSSRSTFECTDAIRSLGTFGTNAKAAVPIMVELLEHSDPQVRTEVTNWLPRIDPEVATKAHVKSRW